MTEPVETTVLSNTVVQQYIQQSIDKLQQQNRSSDTILNTFNCTQSQLQTSPPSSLFNSIHTNTSSLAEFYQLLHLDQSGSINDAIRCIIDIRNQQYKTQRDIIDLTESNHVLTNDINQIHSELQQYTDMYNELVSIRHSRIDQLNNAEHIQIPNMYAKTNEYNTDIELYKQQLNNNNFYVADNNSHYGHPLNITHNSILDKYTALQQLQDECNAMEHQLSSYHNLPPDINLATIKLNEAQYQLKQVELRLTQTIDSMHVNG